MSSSTTSKLRPEKSSIFFKNAATSSKTVIVPAAYLPESYRQDLQIRTKDKATTTTQPIIDISTTSSVSPSTNDRKNHCPNNLILDDSDAEGSLEVLEDQEEFEQDLSIHHHHNPASSSQPIVPPPQRNPKSIVIPSSSSSASPPPSLHTLPNDPLSFTLSPKVFLKSQTTSKKKTRRIALESSDEEQEQEKVPRKTTTQVKRTRRQIDSDDSEDDEEQISIVAPALGSKPMANKRPRLASSSDSESDSDPDCSIAVVSGPKTRPKTRPTTKKLRRKMDLASEEEDEVNLDSDKDEWKRARSERDSEEDDAAHQRVSQDDALRFFNSCDVADLPAVTACTLEQAKIIVGCRPFINAEDMKSKLRKKKGVNSGIMNHYQDMMKGYFEVDRVLDKCEKHGKDLSSIMNIWAAQVRSTSGGTTDKQAPSTAEEEGSSDLVDHLTDAQGLRTEEEKRAFKDYIYSQPPSVPKNIKLKSYQMLGINWMNLLYSKGLSCILADEMGLGKTAQVVCFLSQLKLTGHQGPHLVVVPSSTLENWKREFANFSSNLAVREYYGSQSERAELRYELKAIAELDVVITTYNIATGTIQDRKFLDRMRFDACVYDEGHQLKNSQSKRYKDLMRMRVGWRLLLTGTPLQNNLQELVSLLSFILPKIFGGKAQDDLRMIFKVPSEAQVNLLAQTRITRAKKMMSPFVLRRKKAQVLKELPKKIEKVIYCELEASQSEAYNQLVKKSKKYFLNSAENEEDDDFEEEEMEGFKKNGLLAGSKATPADKKAIANSTTNVLMELRKVSNHPLLFRRQYDEKILRKIAKSCLDEVEFFDCSMDVIVEDLEVMSDFEIDLFCGKYKHLRRYQLDREEFFNSGKIRTLQQILSSNNNHNITTLASPSDAQEGGAHKPSRFLIFSQFTQMLEILKVVLDLLNVKFVVLTGQTNVAERQLLVDQFTNDPSITVFLLSTRAGGLGLNLMAADTVIIFDQDFNPHNDRQAEDRAYRLGQTRDVRVFKLISKGTIEMEILQLATTKVQIDDSISATAPTPSTSANHTLPTYNNAQLPNTTATQSEKSIKKSLMNQFRKRVLSIQDPS